MGLTLMVLSALRPGATERYHRTYHGGQGVLTLFRFFESRLPPYPPAEPHLPPKVFMAFVWDGTRGLRG